MNKEFTMSNIAESSYPLEPKIIIDMSKAPAHSSFSRYLTFENYKGQKKRLKIQFHKTGSLRWENELFPDGIDVLRSLAKKGNRSYWDRMYLENRGGSTTLPIKRLKIIMNYEDPAGSSPSHLNHGEIPIVDWSIDMDLLSGHDEICLDEFAKRSRYRWAGLEDSDPIIIRKITENLGKSGSDGQGQDQYGANPKYDSRINLCSEFVSWYYYELGIKINGKKLSALRDVDATQDLHDIFKKEKKLYRYNSGTNMQSFVHSENNNPYIPKSGDFLERRKSNKAEHSMIIYRWLPSDPNASNSAERYNRAIVLNGPWPATLRLVHIHQNELNNGKDFWLGRVD
jgi:hypothetical protein